MKEIIFENYQEIKCDIHLLMKFEDETERMNDGRTMVRVSDIFKEQASSLN